MGWILEMVGYPSAVFSEVSLSNPMEGEESSVPCLWRLPSATGFLFFLPFLVATLQLPEEPGKREVSFAGKIGSRVPRIAELSWIPLPLLCFWKLSSE